MAGDLLAGVRELLDESRILRWPAVQYADDPARFVREILGWEPWSRQVEILEALRKHRRVAAATGRKLGKTAVAAAAGLHFYATTPGGRVYLVGPRAGQIQAQLWPEITRMHRLSGRCVECRRDRPDGPTPCPHSQPLDGDASPRALTGLRGADDGRSIIAVTSKVLEAVSGYSGPQLWITDESAGVPDEVFDAVEGNDMGDSVSILSIGNPTRTKGRFFELFNNPKRSQAYYRLQISSEEAAEVREEHGLRYGHLATRAKIDEYREIYGEDSAWYTIHVRGQFALNEDGAAFTVHAIAEAVARWFEDSGEGPLCLGVDPAGGSTTGDETAIAQRRGTKCLSIDTYRGLDEDAILAEILRLVEVNARERERPVVVVDREGAVGSVLHTRIIEYLARFRAPRRPPWVYLPVRASAHAERMPQAYPRVRDELIANMERWLRTGSIPDDDKLAKELNSVQWIEQVDQRLKATPKEELRRILERSPDRMDALALACWDSLSLRMQDGGDLPPSAAAAVARDRAALAAARMPAGGWEGFGDDDGGSSGGRRRDPRRVMDEQRGRRRR